MVYLKSSLEPTKTFLVSFILTNEDIPVVLENVALYIYNGSALVRTLLYE